MIEWLFACAYIAWMAWVGSTVLGIGITIILGSIGLIFAAIGALFNAMTKRG